jgi:UDP-2,3-diacylglucosamine hydrolase
LNFYEKNQALPVQEIYVLADAHLGAGHPEAEKKKKEYLVSFLQFVASRKSARLVICGDLFDFWFEYRQVIPRHHFMILAELAHIVQSGLQVDYMAGNHDFWLDSFMQREVGISLHPKDLVLQHSGRSIYFLHGDGLLKKDSLYRMLKGILRSRLNIWLYRLLHPDIGIPFALFCSNLSRGRSGKKGDWPDDADYRAFAYAKIEQGFDLVVLGHTHVAACEVHGSGWYVNPGNWMKDFTYALIGAGQPAIYQWDGQAGRPFLPK